MIRLAKRAPWAPTEHTPWRTRFVLLDGRRFIAEPAGPGLWAVWEVHEDGKVADPDQDFVAHAFTLGHIRLAVQWRVAGKSESEIRDALLDAPRPGTGRNHPHLARRSVSV